MSNLPKLHQEIAETPSKNAVTSPNDPRDQEKDVDRKMRLFGVFQGFREGKLPSNQQIKETLDYFTSTAPFDTNQLSGEGKQLIEDFRGVVRDAEKLLLTKNSDELIQNFLWLTKEIDYNAHKENMKGVSSPVDKGTAHSEGQQAVENLKVLAKLLFTNSEVRKLLSDVSVLGRDVAADAAQHAANRARPSEDQLRNVDEPGPDSEWIAPDGSKRGPRDSVPDTGVRGQVEHAKQKKDEVKQDAQHEAQRQKESAQDQSQRQKESAQHQSDHTNTNDNRQTQQATQQQGQEARDRAQQQGQEAKGRASDLLHKHKPDSMNRDNVKGTAQDQVNKGKDYFKDKFPEERRNKFIYRLKKVIVEQQKHDDYNDAIGFFMDQFYNYKGRANDVANQGAGKGGDVRSDPAYANAEMALRILLERFANNTSMQPIFDAVNVLYKDADNDRDLRAWWHNFGQYVRRCLQEEGYVMDDQCDEDGRRLREDGKVFWDEKYRGHREDLFNSIEDFAHAYNEDPLNKQLGNGIKGLLKSLLYNDQGGLEYKSHLVSDLRHVIIPSVFQSASYFPIPRAEYQDNQFDIVVENLTLQLANILPNIIEIENRNYFKLSAFDKLGDHQEHHFKIGFSQIQADIRDVGFYFKKKTGFPKLSDQGLADVQISGKGIYGDIMLSTRTDMSRIFKVEDVTIHVDKLDFKLRETKHNLLYSLVRGTLTTVIKNAVAKAAQVAIRQALVQLDQQLTDIRDASQAGKEDPNGTRTQAIKQRMQEKKDKSAANKDKAKETAENRNSQFKLVTSRDQEMIDWESKNSHVGKQGDMKSIAQKGDSNDWRSPVFSITKESPTMNKSIANQNLSHK